MKNQFLGLHIDFIGFSASALCSIHCALLPFLLTLAPMAGLKFLDNAWIEYSFIILSFAIASRALIHGYKMHHRKTSALIIGGIGFALICMGQLIESEWLEVLLTSFGGAFVAIAHVINWNLTRKSELDTSTDRHLMKK